MEWNSGVDYWTGLLDWITGGVWSAAEPAHAHFLYLEANKFVDGVWDPSL